MKFLKPDVTFWIILTVILISATFVLSPFETLETPRGPIPQNTPNSVAASSSASASTVSPVQVAVKAIIDGDTMLDSRNIKIRLIGVNSPELNQPYYKEAKAKLEKLILGKVAQLVTDIEKKDTYGRELAYMYNGNMFVNIEMVKNGMAIADPISPNTAHVKEFENAQLGAKKNCAGLWQGECRKDLCVKITGIQAGQGKNLNIESISFLNTCSGPVNLSGYLLKDSSSNSYTFPSTVINKSLTLHTGCAKDTGSDLYWGCPQRSTPVWNNAGDRAFLFDSSGLLVSDFSY
ncbi:MAG: thermonuclease family protein [Candidatus Levyibacteriota bacterium]